VSICTIIVTTPNEVTAEIHDRMPVILDPEEYDAWLSPATTADDAKGLLRPYEGAMIVCQVSKDVGSVKNDRPDLVEAL
jgi:putative SOS response-associated peptidase YedK